VSSVNSPDAERAIPPCPQCQHDHVVRIYSAECAKGIRCYVCKGCGHLWAAADTPKAAAGEFTHTSRSGLT